MPKPQKNPTTAQNQASSHAFSLSQKPFIFLSEGWPNHFSPILMSSSVTMDYASRPLYNRLLELSPGTTEIEAGLATKIAILDKGLRYRVYLRPNVAFHTQPYFTPSRRMNADDVIFSFKRFLDKNHPFHDVGGGRFPLVRAFRLKQLIRDIVKVDDMTVDIHLTRQSIVFYSHLAVDFLCIYSKEYADQLLSKGTLSKLDTHPIGTGPFKLLRTRLQQTAHYQRFDDYWGIKPGFEYLVIKHVPESRTRAHLLMTNNAHLASTLDADSLSMLSTKKNITIAKSPSMSLSYIAMNMDNPKFHNIHVRRALNMAVDKDSIIKLVFNNNAQKAHLPLPASLWGYNHAIKPYEFNVQKAKKLMEKAGYNKNKRLPITLTIFSGRSRPYHPDPAKLASLLQQDFKQIHVDLHIHTLDWAEFLQFTKQGKHEMATLGFVAGSDPDVYMNYLLSCESVLSGSNRARFCHSPMNALIQKAAKTVNRKKRIQYYRQIQNIFHKNAPWIMLAVPKQVHALHNDITRYHMNPFGGHILHTIEMSTDPHDP